MKTPQTMLRDLLDRLFADRHAISKDELLRVAAAEHIGEDATDVISELPDGEYTHQDLDARLLEPVAARAQAREAGMNAHSDPGFVPPNVRRHPSH